MRTLLFDIDGTLLTTDGAGSDAIGNVLRTEFGVSTPQMNLDFSGKTDGYLMAELLRQNGLPVHRDAIQRFRTAYFEHFPESMRRCGGALLPGVASLVARCADLPSIRSFVMTGNCVFTGQEKLRHFDLLGYFRNVFGGDHETHREQLARRTRNELVEHHDLKDHHPIVVIGDTPADVQCGKSIGAITVAVATGRYHRDSLANAKPDVLCDNLTDHHAIAAILGDRFQDNDPGGDPGEVNSAASNLSSSSPDSPSASSKSPASIDSASR